MDVYEFLKNNEKLRSYKLDSVAEEFLGAGKDDMPYELIGEVRFFFRVKLFISHTRILWFWPR